MLIIHTHTISDSPFIHIVVFGISCRWRWRWTWVYKWMAAMLLWHHPLRQRKRMLPQMLTKKTYGKYEWIIPTTICLCIKHKRSFWMYHKNLRDNSKKITHHHHPRQWSLSRGRWLEKDLFLNFFSICHKLALCIHFCKWGVVSFLWSPLLFLWSVSVTHRLCVGVVFSCSWAKQHNVVITPMPFTLPCVLMVLDIFVLFNFFVSKEYLPKI